VKDAQVFCEKTIGHLHRDTDLAPTRWAVERNGSTGMGNLVKDVTTFSKRCDDLQPAFDLKNNTPQTKLNLEVTLSNVS
jgi:hypothetical protein